MDKLINLYNKEKLDIINSNKDDLHCMLEYHGDIYCIEYTLNNNEANIVDYFNYMDSTKDIPFEVKEIIKSLPEFLNNNN